MLLLLLNLATATSSFASMAHHTINPDTMKLGMPEIASVTKLLI